MRSLLSQLIERLVEASARPDYEIRSAEAERHLTDRQRREFDELARTTLERMRARAADPDRNPNPT
jgi:hypothetical protein